ncbi:cadherin domain-containing protein [Candidatus Bipolaricaulota bacterium]|nr:cadherin domain-containing protein [Candidatus Bipolaricaulota bacterium]
MGHTIFKESVRVTPGKLILVIFAVLTFLFISSSTILADDGPPWVGTTLDDLSYTEQEGWKGLDAEVTVTSDTNDFTDGYVEVEIADGTRFDELQLVDGTDLSVDGNVVYWNGDRVGSIDNTYDGSNGRLRINFSAAAPLENSGFESGDLSGWTVNTVGNSMRGQTWAEGPDVLGFTGDSDPRYDDQISGSGVTDVNSGAAYEGEYGLELEITGDVGAAYGTGHTPSVTSSTFTAESGDSLTVRWKASQTNDYYDVFGFLFSDSDGDGKMANENYQLLFHEIGSDTGGWQSLTTSLTIGGDNLRFKFLNGGYDRSGNMVVGSYLCIDEIKLQISNTTTATEAVVQSVIEHLEYRNTSDNPGDVKNYDLNFRESDGGLGYNSARIDISPENDPPTGVSLSGNSVDENTPPGNIVGTLSTTDPDDSSFTYSLIGGDTGSFRINDVQLETAREFDYESQTTYTVQVQSDDGNGGTYDRTFTISVNDVNDKPIADAGPSKIISLHETAILDGSSSVDKDGDSLSFSWSLVQKPSDLSIPVTVQDNLSNPNASRAEFFPTGKGENTRGIYRFELAVSDGNGNSDTDELQITVTGSPKDIKGDSLTSKGVEGPDPGPADFTEEADLKVDLKNVNSGTRGLIGGFQYDEAYFPEDKRFPGPAVKYADVKAIEVNSGNARISVHYTDQEVSQFIEEGLKLYVYYDGSWSEADNINVDTSDNVVQGDVAVSKLTGSPITVSGNQSPRADFAYEPSEPEVNETINFYGALSSDSDGSISTYRWDWTNDGRYDTTASAPTSTHSFPDYDIYTVKLQVVDDDGGTATFTKEVNVGKNTKEGKDVDVQFDSLSYNCGSLKGVKLTFSEVTSTGSTEVRVSDEPSFAQPSGITFLDCFYRIETTAGFKGPVGIEMDYDDSSLTETQEKNLKLFKLTEDEGCQAITESLDPEKNVVSGKSGGFSYFSLGYGTGTLPGEDLINHGPNPVPDEGCDFWLDLPEEASGATLRIYDVDGKPLYEVDLDANQSRYPSTGRWNPQDENGSKLDTGVYIYRVRVKGDNGSDRWSEVHRLVLDRSDPSQG